MSREYSSFADEDLVAILADGIVDEVCDELYQRYRQKIYLWCFGYAHDVDEAVDLTQEIFIKIFGALDGFQGNARLSTWIYRVTRNHCLGRLTTRAHRWRQRMLPIDDVDVADQSCSEKLRQAELAGGLDDLLDRAGRRMRSDELEAFILHYRDGLTVKEITATLGCENATGARTLIQNARRKFKRLIGLASDDPDPTGKEYFGG